jgi:hypothetical protein
MISSSVRPPAHVPVLAVLLAVAAALAAPPAPAWAQLPPGPAGGPDEAAGRKHFEKGQELYTKNRFLEAAKEFEAGYQALPRSAFLLNVGHSYRRAYELRKAKAAYELMLRVDPTTPHRALVEDLIRTIDDALITQDTPPVSPPGVSSPPPVSPPLPTPPTAASNPPLDLTPPVLAETAPPPIESRSVFRSPWFWGAVGAVLVTGTVTTVVLLNRSNGCRAQDCFSAP